MSITPVTPNPNYAEQAGMPVPAAMEPATQTAPVAQPAQAATPQQVPQTSNESSTDSSTDTPTTGVGPKAGPMPTPATLRQNQDEKHPFSAKIRGMAETLNGGAQYTDSYDAEGNVTRTKVPVSAKMLGLALALHALSGAMAGAGAHGPNAVGEAAQAGAAQGQKQVAAKQAAQNQEDQRTTADQKIKLDTVESNLRTMSAAVQMGRFDKENHDAVVSANTDYLAGVKDVDPTLIDDNNGRNYTETEAKDLKKFPASQFERRAVGTVPRLDKNGDQVWGDMDGKIVPAGTKGAHQLWDNTYAMIKTSGDARSTVDDADGNPRADIRRAVGLGLLKPEILQVGNQPVPLMPVSKATHQLAMIDATQVEINSFAKSLNGNKKPSDAGYIEATDLDAAVKADPSLISALQAFQRSAGASKLPWNQITAMAADPKAAPYVGQIRRLFGNDNLQNAQDAYTYQQEKLKAQAAAEGAEPAKEREQNNTSVNAEARAESNEKRKLDAEDARNYGYSFDPKTQESFYENAAQAKANGHVNFEKKTSGDIKADTHDQKVLNDVALKSNLVRRAAVSMSPDEFGGVSAIAKVLADNPNTTFNSILKEKAYTSLSNTQKDYVRKVLSLRESSMGLQKVLTGSARSNETQLQALLNTLPGLEPDSSSVGAKLDQFNQNMELLRAGMPKALPGMTQIPLEGGTQKIPVLVNGQIVGYK